MAKKNITTLEGDCPKFERDETVIAKYSGKPFRGTISVTARRLVLIYILFKGVGHYNRKNTFFTGMVIAFHYTPTCHNYFYG